MVDDLPEDRLNHATFGRLLSEHRVSRRRRLLTLGAAVFLAGAGLVGLPLTFVVGAPGGGALAAAGCLAISLTAAGAAWWSWRAFRREQELAVYLYQRGLVYRSASQETAMAWSDIRSVTMPWPEDRGQLGPGEVVLETAGQERLVMSDPAARLEATQLLAQTIQQEVARQLMPRLQAAVEEGSWLGFGAVRLSRTGLQQGEQILPWEAVERIEIGSGTVTVHRRGRRRRWLEVAVDEIPNLLLFARLAEQHTDLVWVE
jgi:hypothetical protein